LHPYFNELKEWSLNPDENRSVNMKERLEKGFVRECHGDLHLGNIALINDQITLFDCIEFNPELRWIDTISDVAFVIMDLCAHSYTKFAWRFLNHYLAATGDYKGVVMLRYYIVYRALVRAKVEALRVDPDSRSGSIESGEFKESNRYINLAHSWVVDNRPAVIIMHGVSGSGKSTLASKLVEQIGAIQIRSDIERKRLFSLASDEDSTSPVDQGIYTKNATQKTYNRLADLTRIIIKTGFTVIVDASFLDLKYRNQFKQLAWQNRSPYIVISCDTSDEELRKRITQRQVSAQDPSEANLDVLEHQLQFQQPLSAEELIDTFTLISTEATLSAEQRQALKHQIDTMPFNKVSDIPPGTITLNREPLTNSETIKQ
jgi:predicted kinase